MQQIQIDKNKFKFQYLPDYAAHLLKNHLEEFVLVGIRFCREEELPMLKPLAKMPEKDLVKLSRESNRQILNGLVNNNISEFIKTNLDSWIQNKLVDTNGKKILDKFEIVPEDVTLAYYIRRKLFSHFLYGYTQNAAIQQVIISEVDAYTSREELISLKTYLGIQKERSDNLLK